MLGVSCADSGSVTSGFSHVVAYRGLMVVRIGIALVLAFGAGVIALFARWRGRADGASHNSPVAVRSDAPMQLYRADFARPEAPWLVVLFSSATCDGCAKMAAKVEVLESAAVATCEIEFSVQRELHKKYAIDAVPLVVIADHDGVTRRHFYGATSATDVWAAVAELRAVTIGSDATAS